MPKKFSDDVMLAAILTSGGVKAAADSLGVTANALYKRLRDPALRQQLDTLQGAVLSGVTTQMTAALDEALAAILEVLHSPKSSPGLKLSAASTLLSHAVKYVDAATILRRLDALEQDREGE